VTSQTHERADDGRVGVALDGVVGRHARKGGAPSGQLGGDDAEVDNVEGIFDGVVDSGEEGRVVPCWRGLSLLVDVEVLEEGKGVRGAFVEMVAGRETEALSDGRAAEVGVAVAEGGGEGFEGGAFDGGEGCIYFGVGRFMIIVHGRG